MGKNLTTKEFISKANEIHGDKYNYSKSQYVSLRKKVCIICPEHGEFWQRPENHIYQSKGCPKCGMKHRVKTRTDTKEQFISKSILKHGNKYDYSKVEYVNQATPVCIICPIHGEFWQIAQSHVKGCGCSKCEYEQRRKLLYGVGINDIIGSHNFKSYRVWNGMLLRCYNSKHSSYINYNDVEICTEWLTFSNFNRWFEKNYIKGYHLDKDILLKGNRIYSPDMCCFVPPEINTLLLNARRKRGKYPLGVSKVKNKYNAQFRCNGLVRLGLYNTPEEAFYAYKRAKEAHIKEVATKYFNEGKITEKVYDALMNWKIEITD